MWKRSRKSWFDLCIVIFRTNNITEEDVVNYYDSFGSAPVLVNTVTGAKASRIYVHCSLDQYKQLLTEKRLCTMWEFLTFVDAVNPFMCRKCSRFGHIEKFCKADEYYM